MVALLAEGVDRNCAYRDMRYMEKPVALLAEGVDRNQLPRIPRSENSGVALLAEGVDRNNGKWHFTRGMARRPPRGGRG